MILKSPAIPLCPLFGECGGCTYQDIPYTDELKLKEVQVRELLADFIEESFSFLPIVPSPQEYYYRHRLDLKLERRKEGIKIGFTAKDHKRLVSVDACYIARREVSDFIPTIKEEAPKKLQLKHKQANLVVRTGDDGRVVWGGIGRRSNRLREDQYLWTDINGVRVFYSLDTFFQANLSILPGFFKIISALPIFEKKDTLEFFDLYGGVGLFSLALKGLYNKAYIIEDDKNSAGVAQFNVSYHKLPNVAVIQGRVEDKIQEIDIKENAPRLGMIDPPRDGLSERCALWLSQQIAIPNLLYLSCNPQALKRDLAQFQKEHWRVTAIQPFDFFPKTVHVETLVTLERRISPK